MTAPKRPLLTQEDRARVRKMALKAAKVGETSAVSRAYCRGVADVLGWLDSSEMSPMLLEVLR